MKPLAALLILVSAGDYDRLDTPVACPVRLADLGLSAEEAAKACFLLAEKGVREPVPVFAQWAGVGSPKAAEGCLVFVLPGKTAKGTTRTFELRVKRTERLPLALSTEVKEGRHIEVAAGGKPVLRFNHGLMTQFRDKPSKFDRAGYFHPLWAPCGEAITGDFHPDHLHHRGLWFAWVKADAGAVKANFWEIQEGRGKIVNKGLTPLGGPVFAGFVSQNDCVSGDKVVLKETLTARAYAAPTEVRLVDLAVRQEAAEEDVVLGKIHYGGLGFRGRDDWNAKGAPVEVLTSEGKTRANGNTTPATWVDYTGPLPNGRWGGLLVLESSSNPRYPNRLRVHPSMAFFSTTLVQTDAYSIRKGEALELAYRLVLHDGKPDKALAERLAADYAAPPKAELRRAE